MEQQPVKTDNENRGSLYRSIVCSPWLWLTILGILTVLAYSNSLDAPFIFDDIDNISNNHYIRFEKITVKNIEGLVKSPLHGKRPIALFSFALNYYFDKYNVIGYHIVNILIHIVNGLLLFLLIKKTLFLEYVRHSRLTRFSDQPASSSNSRASALEQSRTSYIALFASGLWLLNPVQIFSVTYTVQRMNSLSAMFSLLCILAYIKARRWAWQERPSVNLPGVETQKENSENASDSRYHGIMESLSPRPTAFQRHFSTIFFSLLTFLFAILAITSKQNALLLPLFVILYEFYFISDLSLKSAFNRIKKPKFLIIFILISVPLLAGFIYLVYHNTAANPWQHILSLYHGRDFTPLERLLTQPRVISYYLSLIFFPSPSRMALLVDIPKSTGLFQPVSTLISIVFLGLLILTAIFTSKRPRYPKDLELQPSPDSLPEGGNFSIPALQNFRTSSVLRLLSFAILWFFIGHLLESTIIPLEMVYIHRNYLPSMFIFLPIVAWIMDKHGAGRLSEPRFSRDISLTVLSLILLLFTYWTYSYNRVWETEVAFWEDNVKKSPALPRTHANYGAVLIKSGNYRKAHEVLQKTLNLKPNDTRTLYNIGVAYEQEKKYNEAITYYSKALRQNGNFGDAWRNQGSLLVELGDLKNGLNCLNAAWRRQPYEPITNYEFGHALVLNKHFKRAHFHLIRAVECDPYYVDPILELGLLYNLIDDHKMAKMFFKKAIELDPNNLMANEFLKISENALNN